jgi:hypothetical protein
VISFDSDEIIGYLVSEGALSFFRSRGQLPRYREDPAVKTVKYGAFGDCRKCQIGKAGARMQPAILNRPLHLWAW